MGFPSHSCGESLIRNNIKEVKEFFKSSHENKVKVYNLCIEPERIYNKNLFSNKVGLFPFADHQSCPIRLILQFCADISLYLLKNPEHVTAIHCKAGKGRTGVMICCYLIFSGICLNSLKAFEEYSERRSYVKKGVTIPSQKRYVHHFETFFILQFPKTLLQDVTQNMQKFYLPE